MIYTVTCNPSLDYFVTVEDFEVGKTNRTGSEEIMLGGKGLNVSMVLHNLGMESKALGFAAGFVGREILDRLRKTGIENRFIMLDQGNSRINVKLANMEGTEINGIGPDIPQDKLALFMEQLDSLKKGDYLVLAGSIPNTLPDSIYKDIMRLLSDRGVSVVVDAAGALLRQVLPYRPFLIKPNHHELGDLFGVTFSNRTEVIEYAKKLQKEGAENVLVSMAGAGAVLVSGDGRVFEMDAPRGRLVNAVGAGDSMVAGFLCGWLETGDYQKAFQMAVCTGSASAFSKGLAQREQVQELLEKNNFYEGVYNNM